jgi:hypothetical protein
MDSLGTELVGGQPAAALQYNVHPSGVVSIIAGTPSSVQVQLLPVAAAPRQWPL